MKYAIPVVMLLLFGTSLADADRFMTTRYECSQMEPQRDGIRCALHYLDGSGMVLFIQIHSTKNSPQALIERTKYMTHRSIRSFLDAGGDLILMRSLNIKTGKMMERACTRIAHRNSENCSEWVATRADWDEFFNPLN